LKRKDESDAGQEKCKTRARALVYGFQKKRIEETYSDFEAGDILGLFFDLLYPQPELRPKFAARDRMARRIVGSWIFRITFNEVTIKVARMAIELQDTVDSINERFVDELCRDGGMPEAVGEREWIEISGRVSSREERMRELEIVLFGLGYCEKFVQFFKGVDHVLKFIPSLLLRNSGIIEQGIRGYETLYPHRDKIGGYLKAIEERETAWIERMYGGAN